MPSQGIAVLSANFAESSATVAKRQFHAGFFMLKLTNRHDLMGATMEGTTCRTATSTPRRS